MSMRVFHNPHSNFGSFRIILDDSKPLGKFARGRFYKGVVSYGSARVSFKATIFYRPGKGFETSSGNKFLGKEINFLDLPEDVQIFVLESSKGAQELACC